MDAPFAFDPFDEATRRDPFPLYARARREHPVWAPAGAPVISLFCHDDIQGVLRDPATWSNAFPPPPGFTAEDLPPSMLVTDPPAHTRLRGLVSQAFTPRMIRRLEPRMNAIAAELVEAAVARGRVDLVEALTYPLPVVVIAELIAMLLLILVAGNETTTTLIGNAVLELLAHPAVLAAVRTNPELLPGAVEEVLRFSSPIQMDPRRAVRATEIRGHPIEAGQIVLSWLGSAKRDEAVLERPDEFEIGRRDSRHLAFALGPHYRIDASPPTPMAVTATHVRLD